MWTNHWCLMVNGCALAQAIFSHLKRRKEWHFLHNIFFVWNSFMSTVTSEWHFTYNFHCSTPKGFFNDCKITLARNCIWLKTIPKIFLNGARKSWVAKGEVLRSFFEWHFCKRLGALVDPGNVLWVLHSKATRKACRDQCFPFPSLP